MLSTTITVLMLLAGLYLLLKGGDLLVDGSSALARRFNISELIIGLTIVAFGTSLPELIVSLFASVNNHPEIALGNVIGSNNFNLFVILGIVGIIAPISVQKKSIKTEIPYSAFLAILLLFMGSGFFISTKNVISRFDAAILLLTFALFMIFIFHSLKQDAKNSDNDEKQNAPNLSLKKSIIFILIGLALLVIGGRWTVDASVNIARMFNISEKIIGLTIVAMGTSLPELFTSIVAIRKNSSDIAIGNVIGSNIFNISLILGICGMVKPIPYSPTFNIDIIILILGTALLLVFMFTGKKKKIDRWEAIILIAIYILYTVLHILKIN